MKKNYFRILTLLVLASFSTMTYSQIQVATDAATKIEAELFDVATSYYYGDIDDGDPPADVNRVPTATTADGRTYVEDMPTNMVINYKLNVGPGGGTFTCVYHHKRYNDPNRANIRYLINRAYMGGSKQTAQSKLMPEVKDVWQDFVDTKQIVLPEGNVDFGFLMNFSSSHAVDYFELVPVGATDIDVQTKDAVSVYPNPSETGIFMLSEYSAYKVYGMSGVLIESETADKVDLSNSPNGIYLLHINGNIIKLVK